MQYVFEDIFLIFPICSFLLKVLFSPDDEIVSIRKCRYLTIFYLVNAWQLHVVRSNIFHDWNIINTGKYK